MRTYWRTRRWFVAWYAVIAAAGIAAMIWNVIAPPWDVSRHPLHIILIALPLGAGIGLALGNAVTIIAKGRWERQDYERIYNRLEILHRVMSN